MTANLPKGNVHPPIQAETGAKKEKSSKVASQKKINVGKNQRK